MTEIKLCICNWNEIG